MTDKTRLKRLERIRTYIDRLVDTIPQPGQRLQRKRELEALFRQADHLNPNRVVIPDFMVKKNGKPIQLSLLD